jgi:hypothetical protein
MVNASLEESRLKELLKEALVEVLEERRDLMRGVLEEVLEDVALARAIEAGEGTADVSRDEVFRIFEPTE